MISGYNADTKVATLRLNDAVEWTTGKLSFEEFWALDQFIRKALIEARDAGHQALANRISEVIK